MRTTRTTTGISLFLTLAAAAFVPLSATGCAGDETESTPDEGSDPGPGPGAGDDAAPEVPEFAAGQGQAKQISLPYPAGPYGISRGSIIENFRFIGYANSQEVSDQMQLIELAEFYNPTGEESFPETSHFKGKKPKALLINVASVWCAPCNYEAKSVLPGKYAKYKPEGGEFLLTLADSQTPGEPATAKNLQFWTKKYKVNYPASFDPSYKLDKLFVTPAFPQNFIINTRTMTIEHAMSGSPDAEFWERFDKVLAGG